MESYEYMNIFPEGRKIFSKAQSEEYDDVVQG